MVNNQTSELIETIEGIITTAKEIIETPSTTKIKEEQSLKLVFKLAKIRIE